jgi:hypothetical protein
VDKWSARKQSNLKYLIIALLLTGCSATNSLAPMPNITQPPIGARSQDYDIIDSYAAVLDIGDERNRRLVTNCQDGHVTDYTVKWERLKKDDRHLRIPADQGYWSVAAVVHNDMTNGAYVRGGKPGNRRTYVPGHDETQGGKPVNVKLGKHSTETVLRSIADPSGGNVHLKVQYCKIPGK